MTATIVNLGDYPRPERQPQLVRATSTRTLETAELLDRCREIFASYLVLPEHGPQVLALWTLFTHVYDVFETNPRLFVNSPVEGCGKTTCFVILQGLCARARLVSNITPAVIFHDIDQTRPTLLLDELDTYMRQHPQIGGILNSGYLKSGATVSRMVSGQPRDFSTWAPIALGQIGRQLLSALRSRSIEIRMKRKRSDEIVAAFDASVFRNDIAELTESLAMWADDCRERLSGVRPKVPETLVNRTRDTWYPLLAIAELAGGPWPDLAVKAAKALADQGARSPAAAILHDCRTVFDQKRTLRISSQRLCDAINALEEGEWCDSGAEMLSPKLLALKLGDFGIRTKTIGTGEDRGLRGYERTAFEDAWARYLNPTDKCDNCDYPVA